VTQQCCNPAATTCTLLLCFGYCRVPDELRKHYLSDGEGGQYSTNLDRNRYGNDDQYLFTGTWKEAAAAIVIATAAAAMLISTASHAVGGSSYQQQCSLLHQ
jgi:hypothetical protein